MVLWLRSAGGWQDRQDGSPFQGSGFKEDEDPGALPQAGMERARGAETRRTLRRNFNCLSINAFQLCNGLLHN